METICDETASADVEKTAAGFRVRSSVVASQAKIHARYGGVVPEVAARNHVGAIIPVVDRALRQAKIKPKALDRIAVTAGPGLITSLLVGVQTAKAFALAWKTPLVPINHLRAHVYAAWLPMEIQKAKGKRQKLGKIKFPVVALVVSGGHTELVLMKNARNFKMLGQTLDDAAGEAFDKTAKILGLSYPGGPQVAKLAQRGNPQAVAFPRPMLGSGDLNFSFSGLKTAVLYHVKGRRVSPRETNDLCASIQAAIVDSLVPKTVAAATKYRAKTVVLAGGVAANRRLRERLGNAVSDHKLDFRVPDFSYCTDNAAMIAAAGYFGKPKDWRNIKVDANLPITQ
ncbi:MAG: tRNA (adenosine(37)-N6)-threonylcarbamoyltransferase complex transferase subunit TsaD [bacterium]|nr:tRNA (adenosine(37)-N6)-threonylcarbamoyltransferase complex transferase subunit TsaD [bacterium]